jgi:hypothetical protein
MASALKVYKKHCFRKSVWITGSPSACLAAALAIFGLLACKVPHRRGSEGAGDKVHLVGLVPDEETAKKIAEAVWLPVYGPSVLDEKPFIVKSVGDSTWIVEGTLDKDELGGTAYIEIAAKDARVLKVTHGK